MKLNELSPSPGSTRARRRVGRGGREQLGRHLVPKQLRPSVGRVTEAMHPDERGTGLRGAEGDDWVGLLCALSQFLILLRAWLR